ncbi:MAG: hypothetical protein RMK64_11210 [Rhodovarius sp.]|nr:hypothetical protein [Rhodovarius sp.]MCX7933341.1 hypothetical protein [Rhodovarius sp.]MDW8315529.1 hypothetical protein [Rhodovarius sp.]
MAALASIATLIGAGAGLIAQARQAQAQAAMQRAQAEQQREAERARQEQLAAQQQAEARARAAMLARTVATTRARLAASGLSPDDGSGAALTAGLAAEAAAARADDDRIFRARLAAGRASLLNPDASFTGFLRAGQAFGTALRSLLD